MSKHAEFEASIRDLPPFMLERLNQAKIKKLKEIKKHNDSNPNAVQKFETNKFLINEESFNDFQVMDDSVRSAVCALDKSADPTCERLSVHAFNNLCLAEAITNGKEPLFVCDEDWIAVNGADPTEIEQFYKTYDDWKSFLLACVKLLMKNQTEIKLKQHVTVPLGYRQENFAGDSVDKVCFEENRWKKWFGKLQASTKISEQTLWILTFILYFDKNQLEMAKLVDDTAPEQTGLIEICKFVARSLEVRTDAALSFLKQPLSMIFVLASEQMTFGDDAEKNADLLNLLTMYGIPPSISEILDKQPNLKCDEGSLDMVFFQAMQEDNQALFDFVLKSKILWAEKNVDVLLKSVAMNSVKFKNNDAYFFKLLAASGLNFKSFLTDIIKETDEYSDILKSMERRLVLRNPFLNELSVGEKKDRTDFLRKVKRSNSKSAGT